MTDNIRVNELARELGLTSKEVIEKFAKIQIIVKAHSSSVTPDQVKKLKEFISGGSKVVSKKPKAFIVKKAKADTPNAEPKPEVIKVEKENPVESVEKSKSHVVEKVSPKAEQLAKSNGIKEIDEITLKEVLKNDDADTEEIELTNENS